MTTEEAIEVLQGTIKYSEWLVALPQFLGSKTKFIEANRIAIKIMKEQTERPDYRKP